MYLIQGVFFQNYTSLGISFATGESTAVIKTALEFFVFNGVIGKTLDDPDGPLVGETHDQFGKAILARIDIRKDRLSFIKEYVGRGDVISYVFRKSPNGTWEGEYQGNTDVGEGFTRCVLAEVPDDFLVPPKEALERAKQEHEKLL